MKTLSGLAFAILFLSVVAWGQANVNEAEETAFVYVDGTNGSDSNDGSETHPLKTINKGALVAVTNNQKYVGTRVIINPGTYRESITLPYTGKETNLPVTFEAATTGTAVISGADVWTGWKASGFNPAIFTRFWPYTWGLCPQATTGPILQDIVRRREMIFVNGAPLTQVLSARDMLEGTFYVNEAGGTVYIWPPSGTDMKTATVEVAVRPSLFKATVKTNMVLRGLTFQYANACHEHPAVLFADRPSNNILIDTDGFLWNNSEGLSLDGPRDFTVQYSKANHNGQVGIVSYELKNGLWVDDEASYNNWRGAQGAHYGWARGGAKLLRMHDHTLQGFKTWFNQTYGLHLDTDNAHISVDSLHSAQNLLTALLVEKNEGPITVSNSHLCTSNQLLTSLNAAVGLTDSTYVTLTSSILYDNGSGQISFNGAPAGHVITNWETGQTYTLHNMYLTSTYNTIVGTGVQNVFRGGLGGTLWTDFLSTLVSDENTWWNADNTKVFVVPSPKTGTQLNFPGWQKATQRDAHSRFAEPLSPLVNNTEPAVDPSVSCQATAEAPDYWLVVGVGAAGNLQANPGSQTVTAGSGATYTLGVIPHGGFAGSVALRLDVPSVTGLSASLDAPLINNSGSATLTLTVLTSAATPSGTYPITVLGNSGSLTRTVAVFLVVL